MKLNIAGKDTFKKKNTSNIANIGSLSKAFTSAQLLPVLFTFTGTASENIYIGNGVFIDTDGSVYIASPFKSDGKPCNGIATETKTSGSTIVVRMLGEQSPSGLNFDSGENIYLTELASEVNLSNAVLETATATNDTVQKIGVIGNNGSLIVNIEEPIYLT